ncbi:MAG: hypothetical protein ACR2PW_06360 [Gammaproteobacteria bacterium]
MDKFLKILILVFSLASVLAIGFLVATFSVVIGFFAAIIVAIPTAILSNPMVWIFLVAGIAVTFVINRKLKNRLLKTSNKNEQ